MCMFYVQKIRARKVIKVFGNRGNWPQMYYEKRMKKVFQISGNLFALLDFSTFSNIFNAFSFL